MSSDLGRMAARLDQLETGAVETTSAPPLPPTPPPLPAVTDMSMLLHRGRSALLREVPKGAAVFLSAGCSGGWFFDWVEQCYGRVPRHIGLEYYVPRPDALPPNVEWIANTCSDMSGVADGSCDLVFSGQNLEHLWPDEAVGFFLEAARVTRPRGLLVIDSPNRTITEALRTWSHPEHTVELTTEEAVEVTRLAGFDVSAVKGIWLGRDPATLSVLPFQFEQGQALSLEERLVGGVGQPEHAFLWWIEARRAAREPDGPALGRRMDSIFRAAWPERVARMSVGVGHVEARSDGEWVACPPATPGAVIFGPYMPLRPGRYRCTFHLDGGGTGAGARCEIALGEHGTVLLSQDVTVAREPVTVPLEFELEELQFGVQFRCVSLGGGAFKCRRTVELDQIR